MVFRPDAFEYAMIPVFHPGSLSLFFSCMCCCCAVCLSSVFMCPDVCFLPVSDCMHSLFACLLSPLDGMGRVSQGKTKPTKYKPTIWKKKQKKRNLLICNLPLLTFISPLFSSCRTAISNSATGLKILLAKSPISAA